MRTAASGELSLIVGVEGGQCGNAGAEGVHGVAGLDQVEDLDDLVGKDAVGPQGAVEAGQLLLVGQAAVEEQVCGLFEGGVLRQVVDIVAAVEELAFLAVDEAGLRGVQVDILESLHNLGGHVPTLLPRP